MVYPATFSRYYVVSDSAQRQGKMRVLNELISAHLLRMEIGQTFALISPDGTRVFELKAIVEPEESLLGAAHA